MGPANGTVSKDDEKESGSAKDKAKSHAKNKKKDNENHGKAIEDPFQAMIASIGPGTTTLSGIGNMSVGGEASSNQNNGAAQHQGQVNYDYDTQLALGNKMADDVAPATAEEGGNSTKTMNETESDVPKKDGASLSSADGDVEGGGTPSNDTHFSAMEPEVQHGNKEEQKEENKEESKEEKKEKKKKKKKKGKKEKKKKKKKKKK